MQVITYHSIVLSNKPGEGAILLGALQAAGVNLVAVWGYPIKGKKSVVDLAPADRALFNKTVKKLGHAPSAAKKALLLQGADQPGALVGTLTALAEAGVNVHAVQAVTGGEGRFGAMLQVADADFAKAKRILKAK